MNVLLHTLMPSGVKSLHLIPPDTITLTTASQMLAKAWKSVTVLEVSQCVDLFLAHTHSQLCFFSLSFEKVP